MAELTKLHLGCGPHIFQGWDNIDLNPGYGGQAQDLRFYLQFRKTDSADFIFTEHFIEHLTLEEGQTFLDECYRILKPRGVLRISTPDLAVLLKDYEHGFLSRYHGTWEPKTICQMVNEGMRSWGHQFIYDIQELTRSLLGAGFNNVMLQNWHTSEFPELRDLEVRPWREDLIMEVIKL